LSNELINPDLRHVFKAKGLKLNNENRQKVKKGGISPTDDEKLD
jgi:hypothetical protein